MNHYLSKELIKMRCISKQLMDSDFVISAIISVSFGVTDRLDCNSTYRNFGYNENLTK